VAARIVCRPVEDHAGGRDHPPALARRKQIGIGRFQSHLVVQRADHKLANSKCRSFSEKRLDPQILVHSVDLRGIDLAVGRHGQPAVLDTLAAQPCAHRLAP
jgi:hypothetical protein